MILTSLDARGKAIADELAQAAKLRDEATALLASFEKKAAEAEANAAAIIADARAQAEQLAKETAERMADFVTRRTKQAETKIAHGRGAGRRRRARRRRRSRGESRRTGAARSDAGRGGRDDLVTREISEASEGPR